MKSLAPVLSALLWIAAGAAAEEVFREQAAETGLDFVHQNGMTGEFYMPETVGAGVALVDYDNDGDLDVYLVQGGPLGPAAPSGKELPGDRLYRNDLRLEGGVPRLGFTDVTAASRIRATGYGMGVAAGDYDNDGFVDLYLLNFGPNQLWRNRGDGTFEDVTEKSGTGDPRWSVSASFFDDDRDGFLDLYVANYTRFDFTLHKVCRMLSGAPDYCGPASYEDAKHRLYHNRGDGTFADVSAASGIQAGSGAGLGTIAADYDGDGWLDLYVANDGDPNFLWRNQRDGTFRDEALLAGCAVNALGQAEASMGVDAGDYDNDGDLDLFMTHLTGETHTLYVNDGTGFFDDATTRSGMKTLSVEATGFGVAWFDYDNDSWLDLYVANGAVRRIEALLRQDDPYPLHQRNQLFRNVARGKLRGFADVSGESGAVFQLSEVSRGAAFGDVDNDGDVDVVVAQNNGPVRLLVNQVGSARPWVGIQAIGPGGRDALGAQVRLERPGAPPLLRLVRADGSYASANDPRVVFGLGDAPAAAVVGPVTITWPDGRDETWPEVATGRYHVLRQGSGQPVQAARTP